MVLCVDGHEGTHTCPPPSTALMLVTSVSPCLSFPLWAVLALSHTQSRDARAGLGWAGCSGSRRALWFLPAPSRTNSPAESSSGPRDLPAALEGKAKLPRSLFWAAFLSLLPLQDSYKVTVIAVLCSAKSSRAVGKMLSLSPLPSLQSHVC